MDPSLTVLPHPAMLLLALSHTPGVSLCSAELQEATRAALHLEEPTEWGQAAESNSQPPPFPPPPDVSSSTVRQPEDVARTPLLAAAPSVADAARGLYPRIASVIKHGMSTSSGDADAANSRVGTREVNPLCAIIPPQPRTQPERAIAEEVAGAFQEFVGSTTTMLLPFTLPTDIAALVTRVLVKEADPEAVELQGITAGLRPRSIPRALLGAVSMIEGVSMSTAYLGRDLRPHIHAMVIMPFNLRMGRLNARTKQVVPASRLLHRSIIFLVAGTANGSDRFDLHTHAELRTSPSPGIDDALWKAIPPQGGLTRPYGFDVVAPVSALRCIADFVESNGGLASAFRPLPEASRCTTLRHGNQRNESKITADHISTAPLPLQTPLALAQSIASFFQGDRELVPHEQYACTTLSALGIQSAQQLFDMFGNSLSALHLAPDGSTEGNKRAASAALFSPNELTLPALADLQGRKALADHVHSRITLEVRNNLNTPFTGFAFFAVALIASLIETHDLDPLCPIVVMGAALAPQRIELKVRGSAMGVSKVPELLLGAGARALRELLSVFIAKIITPEGGVFIQETINRGLRSAQLEDPRIMLTILCSSRVGAPAAADAVNALLRDLQLDSVFSSEDFTELVPLDKRFLLRDRLPSRGKLPSRDASARPAPPAIYVLIHVLSDHLRRALCNGTARLVGGAEGHIAYARRFGGTQNDIRYEEVGLLHHQPLIQPTEALSELAKSLGQISLNDILGKANTSKSQATGEKVVSSSSAANDTRSVMEHLLASAYPYLQPGAYAPPEGAYSPPVLPLAYNVDPRVTLLCSYAPTAKMRLARARGDGYCLWHVLSALSGRYINTSPDLVAMADWFTRVAFERTSRLHDLTKTDQLANLVEIWRSAFPETTPHLPSGDGLMAAPISVAIELLTAGVQAYFDRPNSTPRQGNASLDVQTFVLHFAPAGAHVVLVDLRHDDPPIFSLYKPNGAVCHFPWPDEDTDSALAAGCSFIIRHQPPTGDCHFDLLLPEEAAASFSKWTDGTPLFAYQAPPPTTDASFRMDIDSFLDGLKRPRESSAGTNEANESRSPGNPASRGDTKRTPGPATPPAKRTRSSGKGAAALSPATRCHRCQGTGHKQKDCPAKQLQL